MASNKRAVNKAATALYKKQLLRLWRGEKVSPAFMSALYKRGWIHRGARGGVSDSGFRAIYPIMSPAQKQIIKAMYPHLVEKR